MVRDEKDGHLDSKEIEKILGIDLEGKSEEEIEHILVRMQLEERFSGPIPSPSILKGYEEILPGSATEFSQWRKINLNIGRKWNQKS